MKPESHYKWLERNLPRIFQTLELNPTCASSMIVAHGDKCYGYEDYWRDTYGIPFHEGVAVYILSHIHPFSLTVRDTPHGWVNPGSWTVLKHDELRKKYPNIFEETV